MTPSLDRREFALAALGGLLARPALGQKRAAGKIESIDYKGVLIGDCTLPGETRKDDVVPAHPNGIQVGRDRWLVLYATRGFRGVDDDRGIVWQLRKDGFAGPVIKEGMLAQAREYQPFGDEKKVPAEGKAYFKQHGHPVVFGVPKGALVDGKPAPQANLFVAKWRACARILDKKNNLLEHGGGDAEPGRRQTQVVEWVQFKLNDREDDVEIVQPAAVLRQKGFERGPAFCSAEKAAWMNQSFTPPVPFNREANEWADCNHFDGGRVAALKYRFSTKSGLYEWVETGPMLADAAGLSEASLARAGGRWVIAARPGKGGVAWATADDPFVKLSAPTLVKEPASNSPVTAFTGPDGVLRLFTGDPSLSPHKNGRDPLYCWEIDPEAAFAAANRQVLFDSVQAKLPIRAAAVPKVDMCKLLPHQGRKQLVVWRVSVRSYNHPYVGGSGKPNGIPPITADEKAACAIYYAQINYGEEFPSPWRFQ